LAAVPAALFAVGVTAWVAHLPARGAAPMPPVALAALPDAPPEVPAIAEDPPAPPPAPPADEPPPPAPAPTPPAPERSAEAPAAPPPLAFDPTPVNLGPALPAAPAAAPKTCETFGTSVEFAASPAEAAKVATRDGKLLFLLHISGNFEDAGFT
jgi:hypothetical protein